MAQITMREGTYSVIKANKLMYLELQFYSSLGWNKNVKQQKVNDCLARSILV